MEIELHPLNPHQTNENITLDIAGQIEMAQLNVSFLLITDKMI